MNNRQFKEIETSIILASGTKFSTPSPHADVKRPRTAEKFQQKIAWDKKRTPYRITVDSMKQKKDAKSRLCLRVSDQNQPHSATASASRSARKVFSAHPLPMDLHKHHTETHWTEEAETNKEESGHFAPLPTLIVKWQMKHHFAPYNLTELQYLLSRFGEVVLIWKLHMNSAVVVYRDLVSARRALNCKTLGDPLCRLTCQWLYPLLAQPNLFAAVKDYPIRMPGLAAREMRQ